MHTIAIAGSRKDSHVTALLEEFRALGQNTIVLDFQGFPRFNILEFYEKKNYDDITQSDEILIDEIDLLFIRNINCAISFSSQNFEAFTKSYKAQKNIMNSLYSLIRYLEQRVPVINPLSSSAFHCRKPSQYFLLAREGIKVPASLVSNNYMAIKEFISLHNGRVVAKPLASGAEVVMADDNFFQANKRLLNRRPFIFQQFVQGRSYRAYLLGGKLVSAGEIRFDRSFVDWRERDQELLEWFPSNSVIASLEKAVRILKLPYCAVDIEYDHQSGDYYFLDFNPGGLFTGWSKRANINIAQFIAAYVVDVLKNNNNLWSGGRK